MTDDIPEFSCEGNCVIDEEINVCPVCFRTEDEIESWDFMSKTDKQIVLKAIDKRKSVLNYYSETQPPDLSCLI